MIHLLTTNLGSPSAASPIAMAPRAPAAMPHRCHGVRRFGRWERAPGAAGQPGAPPALQLISDDEWIIRPGDEDEDEDVFNSGLFSSRSVQQRLML